MVALKMTLGNFARVGAAADHITEGAAVMETDCSCSGREIPPPIRDRVPSQFSVSIAYTESTQMRSWSNGTTQYQYHSIGESR
jgi:hypothetical protein